MSQFESPGVGRPRRGLPEVPEEDDSPTLVNMPVPRRSALTPSSPGTPLSPLPDPVPRRSALTPGSPVTAPPVPRRSAYTPPSPTEPGQWRAVDKEDDPAAKPPLPVWVKSTAIGVLVLFVVVAGWLVYNLASPPSPSLPSPSTSTTSSGPWELRVPKQVGDYIAGDPIDPGATADDEEVLSANYSDGTNKLLLQLYRPETDVNAYAKSAGMIDAVEVGNSTCGTLEGSSLPMCVRVVDDTAIAVGGHSGQTPETLSALVDEFYARLSGK